CDDKAEHLVAWLDAAAPGADLVVLTGGASVGAYDVVRDVVTAAGGQFRHVRVQPGKPQGWGRWGRTPVVCLPGNPVSAVISADLFVRPLLDRLLGRPAARLLTGVAGTAWTSPAGRRQVVPVTLRTDATGRLVATPAHRGGSGSHLVTSLAVADGYALVPEETTSVAPGDLVAVRVL
ncbi:MAG: molybdopterin molybdenumtransferase MoeA, partial [Actinobacteria bacterium]|nr:molybdopterin molybdenumtransferase MoeA [Actinomycetota bacterium]